MNITLIQYTIIPVHTFIPFITAKSIYHRNFNNKNIRIYKRVITHNLSQKNQMMLKIGQIVTIEPHDVQNCHYRTKWCSQWEKLSQQNQMKEIVINLLWFVDSRSTYLKGIHTKNTHIVRRYFLRAILEHFWCLINHYIYQSLLVVDVCIVNCIPQVLNKMQHL